MNVFVTGDGSNCNLCLLQTKYCTQYKLQPCKDQVDMHINSIMKIMIQKIQQDIFFHARNSTLHNNQTRGGHKNNLNKKSQNLHLSQSTYIVFNCWTLKSLDATQSKSFTRITIGIWGYYLFIHQQTLLEPFKSRNFFNRKAIDLLS
jgi:hypothetical protein